MEKLIEETLAALLTQAGLQPKEGDLERFAQEMAREKSARQTAQGRWVR
jgi:Tfp pilus assembly PilM family ATPase